MHDLDDDGQSLIETLFSLGPRPNQPHCSLLLCTAAISAFRPPQVYSRYTECMYTSINLSNSVRCIQVFSEATHTGTVLASLRLPMYAEWALLLKGLEFVVDCWGKELRNHLLTQNQTWARAYVATVCSHVPGLLGLQFLIAYSILLCLQFLIVYNIGLLCMPPIFDHLQYS